MPATARYRLWVTIDGAAHAVHVAAESADEAQMQLGRDHFRRTTLEYRSGPHGQRRLRVQWANVAQLSIDQVDKLDDYRPQ